MAVNADEGRHDVWLRGTHDEFLKFPEAVREEFAQAIWEFRQGDYPANTKALKGVGGGVHETTVDEVGDTYRVVVTVRFVRAVYILHAFKKKSKQGIKTPLQDIRLIGRRLRDAEDHYREHYA